MKVVNDLLGYQDYKIVQNSKYFSFSLDSILLPNFVNIPKNTKVILDFCTGNAPIPIILSTRCGEKTKIYGIELQKEIYEMAEESLKINKLENRIKLINDNIKNVDKYFEINSIDIITVNPPYFKLNEKSKQNDLIEKRIARHEVEITLKEIIELSKKMLKNDGIIAMVHRTDRLIEIITLMEENNIEPKVIQFIYPKENTNSNLVLIEGRKNANSGLKILEPLIIHDENGNYRKEIEAKYFRR